VGVTGFNVCGSIKHKNITKTIKLIKKEIKNKHEIRSAESDFSIYTLKADTNTDKRERLRAEYNILQTERLGAE